MKILMNHIIKEDREIFEAFGGTKEDIVYSYDEHGNKTIIVSEELAKKMMTTIANHMLEKGLWTEEDAKNYLEHGSEE